MLWLGWDCGRLPLTDGGLLCDGQGMGPRPIAVTASEAALVAQIDFAPSLGRHDAPSWRVVGNAAVALMASLIARKAIPPARMKFFTHPDCNIGGRGRSHCEVFEQNGKHGEAIFRDPNFVARYLRYFIYGPELPAPLVQSFEDEVAACGNVTSGDVLTLAGHAKRLAREYGLGRAAADEFFRLALDCGLDPSDARVVRGAVMQVR